MVRVILVDDERFALDELEFLLKKHTGIEIAAAFDDPVTALEEVKNINFEAAFLDIDMPVINGLNVARELIESYPNIKIIFATAHDDYAVKAFDLNAIDYILKPIEKDRLDRAVEKLLNSGIKNSSMSSTIIEKLNRIDQNLKQDSERFPAYDDDEINLLKISDIYYFEAQLGKTVIVSNSGNFKTKETMDTLEIKLTNLGFFRCHRSYLVNLRYTKKLSPMFNNNYILNQEDVKFDIPVSRNRIKDLKTLLGIA